jgi:hypothetical protein
LRFSVEAFDQVVAQIVDLAKADVAVDPKRFYPVVKKRSGLSRDLPLVDEALRDALTAYLAVRLEKVPSVKPTDPLFIAQIGTPGGRKIGPGTRIGRAVAPRCGPSCSLRCSGGGWCGVAH